jgi:hypothetical protein
VGFRNPWPVATTPHSPVPIVAETLNSTLLTRLIPPLGAGLTGGPGVPVQSTKLNSASQLSNFNFAFSGVDWAVNSGAVDFITNDSTGYAQTGESYAQIWNASGGSRLQTAPGALIPCTPGSPWAATASFRSNSGPNAAVTLYLLYFTAAKAIISGYVSVSYNSSVDAGWVAETVSSTAPSNASYVGVQMYYGGSTGLYAVDNVYLVQPSAVGGGLGLNSSGAVIVLPGGITSTQLGAAAVQAANVAAAAITAAAVAVGAITNPALAADCVQAANIVSLTASQITADSSIVGQLQAGTVTAAVSFTAPSLTITNTVTAGGYTTVNLLQVNSTFNILATQTVTVVATGQNYLTETCEVVGTGIVMTTVSGPGWTHGAAESYSAQYDANVCEIINNETSAGIVLNPDSGITVTAVGGSVYAALFSTGLQLPLMSTLPNVGPNLAVDGSGNLRFQVGGVWKTVTVT